MIGGAHAAAAKAEEYGIKVIVGEEVKTGGQGEVIGLFISEQIPRCRRFCDDPSPYKGTAPRRVVSLKL